MTKLNIKEFIAYIDGGQQDDTEIVITMNGEEIANGTLEEAQTNLIKNGLNMFSSLIVKSFMFGDKFLSIDVEEN